MSSIFVVQLLLCLTPCDPMDCSAQSFPVLHYLPEVAQIHVHWVGDASNHLILCQPHLLWPSIFPSIRVFPNESALHIRWPKYWSFNFSIRASNEYSGLILLRINRFDLLAAQRALKSLFQHQFEGNNSPALSLSYGPSLTFIYEYWKNHSFDYIINSQNFIIINKL